MIEKCKIAHAKTTFSKFENNVFNLRKHYTIHIRNVWNQRGPLFNHRLCEHVKELATVCLINLPWKQINLEDFHDLLHMLCVGSLCRFLNGYAGLTPSRRKRFTKLIQSKSIVILLFTGSDLCLSVKYNNFPIIYVNILLHQLQSIRMLKSGRHQLYSIFNKPPPAKPSSKINDFDLFR